jgi:hypothetical protein
MIQANPQRQEAARAAQVQRMQQYWDSGDPILMAEAQQWETANPGTLTISARVDLIPTEPLQIIPTTPADKDTLQAPDLLIGTAHQPI